LVHIKMPGQGSKKLKKTGGTWLKTHVTYPIEFLVKVAFINEHTRFCITEMA